MSDRVEIVAPSASEIDVVIVTATGARSEIGRIGAALRATPLDIPRLQAQVGRLVRRMGVAGAEAYDSRRSIIESIVVSVGATTITSAGGNDTITVKTIAGHTTIDTGAGADVVNVGSDLNVVDQITGTGNGFGRMVVIREAIKSLAEEFPDEQAAA